MIVDLFHRMDEVEKAAGVPAPRFEATGFFTVTFRKSKPADLSGVTGQVPDKPRSSKQRYVTTAKGLKLLKQNGSH